MDFPALAAECAPWVAPQTLAAIVRTESGFRPYAIGVNKGFRLIRQPVSREEAIVTARWLIDHGYNIDLGLGQINSANLTRLNLSIEDAFDPCRNLAASATILGQNYASARQNVADDQQALRAALSAYNTGSFSRGFSNGYVQKVLGNAGAAAPAPVAPGISHRSWPPAKADMKQGLPTPDDRSSPVYTIHVGENGTTVRDAQGVMVFE